MGLITGQVETRAVGDTWSDKLVQAVTGGTSSTGEAITPRNSLQVTAVWDAVQIISGAVASLPLILFRRTEDGGKERATDHRLFRTLHKSPNPWMTKMQFVETLQVYLLTWGNGYANIERQNDGTVNLWPIPPKRVDLRVKNNQITYKVKFTNRTDRTVQPEDMFHIRGMSWNGIQGISPIRKANDAVGLARATEKFGASYFRGDGMPRGALTHPDKISPQGQKNFVQEWTEAYSGLDNAHRVAILEEGMDWTQIGIPPEDSQFIESRQFQVLEIARLFNIQPHKLKTLKDSNRASTEQANLEFLIHTIRPWLVRWEEEIERSLIPREDEGNVFAEHIVEGFLRGDSESRAKFFQIATQSGWMNRNEVRIKENLNPVEGLDTFLFPANQIPVGQEGRLMDGDTDPEGATEDPERSVRQIEARQDVDIELAQRRSQIATDAIPVFEDAGGRILRREAADIREIIERHLPQQDVSAFHDELNHFLFDDHVDFVRQQLRPPQETVVSQIVRALGDELEDFDPEAFGVREFLEDFSRKRAEVHIAISARYMDIELNEAEEEGEAPDQRAEDVLDRWTDKRPTKMAREESHEAGNAAAVAVFATVGIERMAWTTVGENCPNCTEMKGKTISVGAEFVQAGESFGPRDFTPSSNVGNPPLHAGCDCLLIPG